MVLDLFTSVGDPCVNSLQRSSFSSAVNSDVVWREFGSLDVRVS